MSLKILIATPHEEWNNSTKEYLEKLYYEVEVAPTGKKAQIILATSPEFFAIILGHSLRDHSGMQVLHFVSINKKKLKVMMVFESEEYYKMTELTEKELLRKGVSEFHILPIQNEVIKNFLEGHQKFQEMSQVITPKPEGTVSEEEEVELFDNKFTSIKIDNFYNLPVVYFDIYIRLQRNHYVKILHAGDSFDKKRIDKYKNEKNVEYLFFLKEDRKKYLQTSGHIAKKIIPLKQASTATKISMMKSIGEKFIEEACSEGVKPQIIEQGKEICNNVYEVVERQPDLFRILRDFEDFDPKAVTHTFAVTLFATSIIKQFQWESKVTIQRTALACMFHDIGKIKLSKDLVSKRPNDMTEEEFEQYKTHPRLGVELLEDMPGMNNTVKQIIYQHHEHYDGTGFPLGIKGKNITTLGNIICLANEFIHIIEDERLKPVDSLKKILATKNYVTRYNSEILENFIKVFIDPRKFEQLEKDRKRQQANNPFKKSS